MNPLILNREFQHPADGWYQIERKGQHPNRAAGVVQVIDDEAAQAIVNRFNADAAAGTLRHGHELLIDHEHFSDQVDKESRAYGWLTQLQNRADGIYGQVRWTKTGKEAVDGGDYRFFSTEYDPDDLKVVNKEARHVRPLRLAGLTLTNMHNNRGQRPITNREGAEDAVMNRDGFVTIDGNVVFVGPENDTTDDEEGGRFIESASRAIKSSFSEVPTRVLRSAVKHGSRKSKALGTVPNSAFYTKDQDRIVRAAVRELARRGELTKNRSPHSPGTSPEAQSTVTQKPNMKSIAAELGLAPEAAEEAVLGEVRKLKNRADHVTAITTERDALKARNAELEAEQVDGLLAAHGVKEEKVINRLKPVLAAMKNREERVAALLDFGFKPAEAKVPAGSGRVLNRGEGKQPAAPAANEQELARQAEAQITEYKLKNRCTYAQARNAVRSAKPELFGLNQ